MAPDLALIALIAFYITVSIYDVVKLWRVERKATMIAREDLMSVTYC